jgi:hypothetical protein
MADEINFREILRAEDDESKLAKNGNSGGMRIKGRLAGGVRDKLTMAEMKARISALWKDGATYLDIAETVSDEFGLEGDVRLKANGIHYHIKSMLDHWRNIGLLNIDQKQAMVLARWDQLESICLEAYFKSMEGNSTEYYEKQVTRAKSKDREEWFRQQIAEERAAAQQENRKPEVHDLTLMAEQLFVTDEKIKEWRRDEQTEAGDPRWIKLMIEINDKRCKMWGLYNKDKDAANPDQEMARLADSERDQRLVAVLTAASNRVSGSKGLLAKPAPIAVREKDGESAPAIGKVTRITRPVEDDEFIPFD